MIQYLVSKGADVKAVNREGQTTVDMANGPVQRIQPFPETIALLEKLGREEQPQVRVLLRTPLDSRALHMIRIIRRLPGGLL